MPRQSRIDSPGTLHHIIARGIERRSIFDDDQDRYAFLERMASILTETRTACYAWEIIPNHFHLRLRTGTAPVATIMRRLLTGHTQAYNRRHRRHGHLFQNRYKSMLCQEDSYFLELVRYIHLNPLRAGLVKDLAQLDKYPFSGHGAIMGRRLQDWKNSEAVLACFGKRKQTARSGYRAFMAQGIGHGKRQDLTGGGLIRSVGGWDAVKALRKKESHLKGDERILGDSDFVSRILSESKEVVTRRYAHRAEGMDEDFIAEKVAEVHDYSPCCGRLTFKLYPDGSSVALTYLGDGKRETVTDSWGVTSYFYDSRGRLESLTSPDGSRISYGYDAKGNRTSVTVPIANDDNDGTFNFFVFSLGNK